MDIQIKKKHPLLKYKYFISGGLIFLAILFYVFFEAMKPAQLRYELKDLQISEAKKGKFMEYLEVEGVAQPKLTIKLNCSESGTVARIVADDGSMLQKGDTILLLSNPELRRAIEDEKDGLEKQQISFQEKNIQMKRLTAELKRNSLKTIYELDKLSKQYNLDKEEYKIGIKSKAQLAIATDDYRFNQKNTNLLLEELKHDSLMNIIQTDLMQTDLRREEKKFARSRERLENLVIRAPIAGQLSFVSVIPGESVGAGSNIGELKKIDELKISTKLSESYIDRIFVGLPASITYQDKKYMLRISKINPEIKDRLFGVDLVFMEKVPDNIRIGKSYRIQIELGHPEDALVVDKGNFFQSTGGQWIFKLNASGDRAMKSKIAIGRQNPVQYEILEGLKPGERVITSGYDNFGDAQELILK